MKQTFARLRKAALLSSDRWRKPCEETDCITEGRDRARIQVASALSQSAAKAT